MRNLDGDSKHTSSIHNSLAEATSLLSRGLYDYALEHTEKILKRAISLELYNLLPGIISVKQSCLRALSRFDELKKLNKENDLAIERYRELFEMMQLSYAITTSEERRELNPEDKKLFQHPLLKKKPAELKTVRAFIIWFNIKAREQIIFNGDIHKWIKVVEESVRYGEKQPGMYEITPLGFLYMYTDLISAEAQAGNYNKALSTADIFLQKLQKLPKTISKPEIDSLKLFTSYLKVYTLRNQLKFKEAVVLAEKIYGQRHLRSVYDQFSFTMEYALALFHTGQTNLAMEKLNELLRMNTDVRSDYQLLARLLQIMAQLDLGNYALVPYLVKSTLAWMKRRKMLMSDAEIFFSLTIAIAKAPETLRRQRWLKLQQTVKSGAIAGVEKEVNLKNWLERKLTRQE